MKPFIKICCISSEPEARMAIEAGASAIGLVGKMPSGPGVIDDERIQKIARQVSPSVDTFLLTSETDGPAIAEHHKRTATTTIQIVDTPKPGTHQYLKEKIPSVKRVQVIHVLNEQSIDEAILFFDEADALLLDSGDPNLKVKELGGTGRTHNWLISKKIVEMSPLPVYLAGGLHPENAKQAYETVQPFGLDICSGVRTNGKLDLKKLARFMSAVFS